MPDVSSIAEQVTSLADKFDPGGKGIAVGSQIGVAVGAGVTAAFPELGPAGPAVGQAVGSLIGWLADAVNPPRDAEATAIYNKLAAEISATLAKFPPSAANVKALVLQRMRDAMIAAPRSGPIPSRNNIWFILPTAKDSSGVSHGGAVMTSLQGIGDAAVALGNMMNAWLATPRKMIGGFPIWRRSVSVASGGRIADDPRAFNMKVAPHGVSSVAANGRDGYPLSAEWPYGLDADRFALPPPPPGKSIGGGMSTGKKVAAAAGAGALVYLLFFM